MQLTAKALEILEGLSGTPEGLVSLRPVSRALCQNLLECSKFMDYSRTALTALVNASQDVAVAREFVEAHACTRLVDYLQERACGHPDLIVMALCNLTQSARGACKLLQVRCFSLKFRDSDRFLCTRP